MELPENVSAPVGQARRQAPHEPHRRIHSVGDQRQGGDDFGEEYHAARSGDYQRAVVADKADSGLACPISFQYWCGVDAYPVSRVCRETVQTPVQ